MSGLGEVQRGGWRVGEVVAWVVILLSVAAMFGVPLAMHRKAAAQAEKISEYQPELKTLISGRYVVGLNKISGLKATGQAPAAMEALENAATTPHDKLRVAIVRGEVEGTEVATAEAGRLAGRFPELKPDVQTLRDVYDGTVTDKAWRDFHERHGWFAELAKSAGKPAGDPLRTEVMASATRTMATMVGAMAVVIAAGIAGLGLLIVGIVFFYTRRLAPMLGRVVALPAGRVSYLEGFAVYLGLMAGLGLGIKAYFWMRPTAPAFGMWANLFLPVAFLLGVLWPKFRGQSWGQWRAVLGLHAGKGILREMACGAAGYLAGLPIFVVGIGITFLLTKLSGADPSHPISREISGGPGKIALLFFLACVFAPITEELMFRGAFFGYLRSRFGFWVPAAVVALLFAIIHPQGWAAVPALGSLALVLAGIREWRGSIVGCMTAHAINNFAVMVMLILMLR